MGIEMLGQLKDGNGTTSSHPRPIYLFKFQNPSPLKKLNEARQGRAGMGKSFTFDIFYIYFIFVFIFIILKLIYFIKNKNIMNFYKVFIKI